MEADTAQATSQHLADYSVVIRTLGIAGEKYRALLDSLKSQTIQPREVLVVLPDGREPPADRLGTERFVTTRKGLVHQRSFGIRQARGDYVLLCDDDISFDKDFVEKLYRTHVATRAMIVTPRVLDPGDGRPPSLKTRVAAIRDFLCGLHYASSKPSPFYIRIWDTGGYINNARMESRRQYYSQSGHGTCSFLKREAAVRLRFEDEIWLEGASYALPDDQVMFYKAFLQGNSIAWCREARLHHLDAGGDTPDRFRHMSYANARNFTIFWHRFQYRMDPGISRRISLVFCLSFRVLNTCLYYAAAHLWDPRRSSAALALFKGYIDALRYIRSEDYGRLPVMEAKPADVGRERR